MVLHKRRKRKEKDGARCIYNGTSLGPFFIVSFFLQPFSDGQRAQVNSDHISVHCTVTEHFWRFKHTASPQLWHLRALGHVQKILCENMNLFKPFLNLRLRFSNFSAHGAMALDWRFWMFQLGHVTLFCRPAGSFGPTMSMGYLHGASRRKKSPLMWAPLELYS